MTNYNRTALLLFIGAAALPAAETQAQGLLWNLPPDGSWVRFEGTYSFSDRRPGSVAGDVEPWTRSLWIGVIGTEMAEYQNQMVPCRWIEIHVNTGRPSEAGLDPGPLGLRKYKVLVPESGVPGKLISDEKIPVSMIPIVKGYRQFGDGPVEQITTNVLQVYPVICLLQHYRQWQPETDQPAELAIRLGTVQAIKYTAKRTMESPRRRSTTTAEIWRSDQVPFGLARWNVTVLLEEKDSVQPRSQFAPVSQLAEQMEAHESGTTLQNLPNIDLLPVPQ